MSTRVAQAVGFAAWGALALLQVIWHAWWAPPNTAPPWVVLAVALVPLAVPLVYWRAPRKALLLAGMIGLFYFCHGVVEAWADPHARVFAWIEIALVVVLVLAQARLPKRRAARSG